MEYNWSFLIWILALACSPIDSKEEHSFLERLRGILTNPNSIPKLNKRLEELYSTPTEYMNEVKDYHKRLVSDDQLLKIADENEHSLVIEREGRGKNYKEYLEVLCKKEIPKSLLLKTGEFSAELGVIKPVSSIATTSCKISFTSVSQEFEIWIQSFNMNHERKLGKYFNLIGRMHNEKEFIAMEIIEYSDGKITERMWPLPETTTNSFLQMLALHKGSKSIRELLDVSDKGHRKELVAYYEKLRKENKLLPNGKEAEYDKLMNAKGYKRDESTKQEDEAKLVCKKLAAACGQQTSSFYDMTPPFANSIRGTLCRIEYFDSNTEHTVYLHPVTDQRHLYLVGRQQYDSEAKIEVLDPYDMVQLYDGAEIVVGVLPPKPAAAAGPADKAQKMSTPTSHIASKPSKPGNTLRPTQSKKLLELANQLEAGVRQLPSAKGSVERPKRTLPGCSEKSNTASRLDKPVAKKEPTAKEAAQYSKSLMAHSANAPKGGKSKGPGATKNK